VTVKPITSGLCEAADRWPVPDEAHDRCRLAGCACRCHQPVKATGLVTDVNGAPLVVTLTDDEREQRCRREQISHEHYTREAVERIVADRVNAVLTALRGGEA
jgi:hypothetical protein